MDIDAYGNIISERYLNRCNNSRMLKNRGSRSRAKKRCLRASLIIRFEIVGQDSAWHRFSGASTLGV